MIKMDGWTFVRGDPPTYHIGDNTQLGWELYSEVVRYREDGTSVTFRNSMGYFKTREEAEKKKRQVIALDALLADSGDLE